MIPPKELLMRRSAKDLLEMLSHAVAEMALARGWLERAQQNKPAPMPVLRWWHRPKPEQWAEHSKELKEWRATVDAALKKVMERSNDLDLLSEVIAERVTKWSTQHERDLAAIRTQAAQVEHLREQLAQRPDSA